MNWSGNGRGKFSGKHFWLCAFVCSCMLMASKAYAVTCGFSQKFNDNVTVPVVGPGLATAGEDVPVGKVLYQQTYLLSKDTTYSCTVSPEEYGQTFLMNVFSRMDVISTPSGAPTRAGETDTFPTNVPGIGAVITINGSIPFNAKYPNTWERNSNISIGTSTQDMGIISLVEIKFVKTGPIPSGTQQITGAALPTFQISAGSTSPVPEENIFVTLNFTGTTTMHTKTCQLATPDIDVNLGKHQLTNFNGPGAVTAWKDFDIVLKDCPPFHGYGNYIFDSSQNMTIGASTDNAVTIGFRSVYGVNDSNPALAKLESGPNAATGVGIELSERNATARIPLDGTGGFNVLNLPKEDNSTVTIPLKARYVQTDTNVQAGQANGAVVFTITYQ
ncbi:fimbrial protein [Klebsiella sp. I138]|uniref:fimbrial protein n=1 Tax=Klebsiella sp. I138 TaxID=2755385 RepID=UPI003DA9BD20